MIPSFVFIVKSLKIYDRISSSDASHIDSYIVLILLVKTEFKVQSNRTCILHDKAPILTSVRLVCRDAITNKNRFVIDFWV